MVEKYSQDEHQGRSFITSNTEHGESLLLDAKDAGCIMLTKIDHAELVESQFVTITRKSSYKKHRKIIQFIRKLICLKLYQRLILSNAFFLFLIYTVN